MHNHIPEKETGDLLILHITWNVDSKVSEENSAPLFRGTQNNGVITHKTKMWN